MFFLGFVILLGACSDRRGSAGPNNPESTLPPGGISQPDGERENEDSAHSNSEDVQNGGDTGDDNETCGLANPCPMGLVCVVSSTGTSTCVQDCSSVCPEDWTCTPVEGTLICTPPGEAVPGLCLPCFSDADCMAEDPESHCLDYGFAGQFCGVLCSQSQPCPTSFGCSPTPEFGENINHCFLLEGTCECSPTAIANQASTPCSAPLNQGECVGIRYCTEEGLTLCNVGIAEICDGVDNNCDGTIDEGLEECSGSAGEDVDQDGFTLEEGDCDDSSPIIAPGLPDICDGINNDCDDEIDENGSGGPCELTNDYGVCPGTFACTDGALSCEGEGATVCETCDPLPDKYGVACGCSGVIGCEGTCEGDTQNPCTPTPCFVSEDANQGTVGCPEICSVCAEIPWRMCKCSAEPGSATLVVSPGNLTVGEELSVAFWTPTPLNSVSLRVNSLNCLGASDSPPCPNPDGCGGEAYIWKSLPPESLQIGTNQLEIISGAIDGSCGGPGSTVVTRGFVPMVF